MEAEAAAEAVASDEDVAKAAAFKAEKDVFAVRFGTQLSVFDRELFPPDAYDERNGASRKDGYWAFVHKNEEPNQDYTYGEFPLPLFSKLVDRACEIKGFGADRSYAVLMDLGSGAGRLALWAAATSVWRRVVGVEYLASLAVAADEKLHQARSSAGLLLTEQVELVQGSWDDPLECFDGVDVAFAYTTAITTDEHGVLAELSSALSRRLPRGCLVVTTDYKLDPVGFECLESIEGENRGVGGVSTGFIHRKICAGERDTDANAVTPLDVALDVVPPEPVPLPPLPPRAAAPPLTPLRATHAYMKESEEDELLMMGTAVDIVNAGGLTPAAAAPAPVHVAAPQPEPPLPSDDDADFLAMEATFRDELQAAFEAEETSMMNTLMDAFGMPPAESRQETVAGPVSAPPAPTLSPAASLPMPAPVPPTPTAPPAPVVSGGGVMSGLSYAGLTGNTAASPPAAASPSAAPPPAAPPAAPAKAPVAAPAPAAAPGKAAAYYVEDMESMDVATYRLALERKLRGYEAAAGKMKP